MFSTTLKVLLYHAKLNELSCVKVSDAASMELDDTASVDREDAASIEVDYAASIERDDVESFELDYAASLELDHVDNAANIELEGVAVEVRIRKQLAYVLHVCAVHVISAKMYKRVMHECTIVEVHDCTTAEMRGYRIEEMYRCTVAEMHKRGRHRRIT